MIQTLYVSNVSLKKKLSVNIGKVMQKYIQHYVITLEDTFNNKNAIIIQI